MAKHERRRPGVSGLHLTRIDPARNMARFYLISVQPDLFGRWTIVREWGRIGQGGTVRSNSYACPAEALAAMERLRRIKERRGYRQTQALSKFETQGGNNGTERQA